MTYMAAILNGRTVQTFRQAGSALLLVFFLLTVSSLSLFAQSAGDAPEPYPLLEEFDTPATLDVTMPDKVGIVDGKVLARVQGEGEQYVHRAIPAFSGNVRIRVRGQINDWENNCFVSAGIGDGLGSGSAIRYGYFGGGCPVNGSLVDAHGVNLAHGTDGCNWLGTWLWTEQGRPYESTLTIQDGAAELAVAGVGVVTGTLTYDGVYSQLYVGATGRNVSSNFCSVDIESIEVEPLPGARMAVTDLTADVVYPTQVELRWTHAVPDAAVVRIERTEAERDWREIAAVDPDANSFVDNRVTCGLTYAYRVDIYTEDGRHTGHSNVATATTPACTIILEENWEGGIDPERWTAYGDPTPRLVSDEGMNGSTAFEANGDGDFHSGVTSNQAFDITSGLGIEFRMKGTGVIGEKYSSTAVWLTPCTPDDDLEVTCRTAIVQAGGGTETGLAIYGAFTDEHEQLTEPWAPLNGTWHHYRMDIKPDGLVDFYRDDELKFTTTRPIDFGEQSLLHLHIGGKSQNGEWRLDDLRVSAPAPPEWYVKVVDEAQRPVANAEVFANGQSLGLTSQAGMIPVNGLDEGVELVAVHAVDVTPSARLMHDGWAYVTNLTNIRRQDEELLPYIVTGPGEQLLALQQDYPLILFNLLISVEWDATDAYLEELARAVKLASNHLLDLTDGQMAFGNVAIYGNGQHWAEADIQISTKNIVRPHAYIGGILDDDTSRIMRIGRGWNGISGNEGAWDEPEGYRTLVHEFGHYALYLYDEYVAYEYDREGNVLGERPAFCPAETAAAVEDESVRASAMYDGYRATELSAQGVPGLWSAACEETLQFQYTGQSAWETLADAYADRTDPPRWRIVSPLERQAVLAGPNRLPDALPDWPAVTLHRGENPEPPRMLIVLDPAEQPAPNAIVALYRQSGVQVIGQGLTDGAGRLAVFGANAGDMIRAATFDGGYAGDAYVGQGAELIVRLAPVVDGSKQNVAYGADRAIPHMRVVAEPSLEVGQIDLLLSLYNFSPNADLGISISEPGDGADYSPVLGYSPSSGIYNGGISFPLTERGVGRVRVFGSMDDSRVRLQSAYRLQRVRNDHFSEVYSDDGNFYLQIDGGSLPATEAFFVVMPPGAVPGPLPAGMTLIGDPYDVTASGALAALEKPAALALHYDRHLLPEDFALDSMAIYRWDPVGGVWRMVDSELDEEQGALTGAIRALGVYAILAPEIGGAPAAVCDSCLLHAEPGDP